MDGGCSLVRELHVYGTAAPVHSRDPKKFQHQVSLSNVDRRDFADMSGYRNASDGRGRAHREGGAWEW